MIKTESIRAATKTIAIESCHEWLQCELSEGVRAAIPHTNNLIMVGPADWIAANVPGVEAMVAGALTDERILEIAVNEIGIRVNTGGGALLLARAIEREVITRLAATTQASTARTDLPEVLFDGHTVYQEALAKSPNPPRTSPDNVAEVLDAVVRLLRRDSQASTAQAERVPVELAQVREQIEEGSGFWHTCSGCHESEDGHDNGHYLHSAILGCKLGMGCSECGGIGAVWDNTDYGAMAADMLAAMSSTDAQAAAEVRDAWISVDERLPECSKKPGSLGVEVIVYPRPEKGESTAFFGCRHADDPVFYKYGSRVEGITHWMPLPEAPSAIRSAGDTGGQS